jgi:hypothetical protein
MRIEAVTVSVGYGDFLRETLPANLPALDDLVVVTSPADEETRGICKELSVRHILSDEHRRDGPFNKARLIQRGFDQIEAKDWILHLDADIVLPRAFRRQLELAHLDERCIYGADRCHVQGFEAWSKIKQAGGWSNHRYESVQKFAHDSWVGDRHVPTQHGYCPIGYFQLFHGSAMIDCGFHLRQYPLRHGDAARTDVQFALQWDRRLRQLLPEVVVLHLDSGAAPQGANWEGRTTARFGAQKTGPTGPLPGHHHHHRPPRRYF